MSSRRRERKGVETADDTRMFRRSLKELRKKEEFRGRIHNTYFSLKKRTEMAAASYIQQKEGEEGC
jgi:hypothetical protein